MKLLSLLCVLVFVSSAQGDFYHRFWRGNKLATLSATEFTQGLSQVFIPATIQTGAQKGFIAYEPVLPTSNLGLPDEIALVSYESKTSYDALFATSAGKTYQNLHWQYFDRSSSHSLAPLPFSGDVAFEKAYDLHPDYNLWEKNKTTVLIFLRQSNEADADFLARTRAHFTQVARQGDDTGVQDRIALVSQQYWIEYVSAKKYLTESASSVILLDSEPPPRMRALRLGMGSIFSFSLLMKWGEMEHRTC